MKTPNRKNRHINDITSKIKVMLVVYLDNMIRIKCLVHVSLI